MSHGQAMSYMLPGTCPCTFTFRTCCLYLPHFFGLFEAFIYTVASSTCLGRSNSSEDVDATGAITWDLGVHSYIGSTVELICLLVKKNKGLESTVKPTRATISGLQGLSLVRDNLQKMSVCALTWRSSKYNQIKFMCTIDVTRE